ncbi:MAG: transporter associated domain-containing protein, partial [Aquificaceae bacterium]
LSRIKTFTKPVLSLSTFLSRSITNLLKDKYQEKLSKEDLIRLMEEVASREENLQIAFRILTLKDLFITEEVKPLREVVMVEEGTPLDQTLRIMQESGYRRLPVYRNRVDQIIGYVDLFDLIQNKHAKFIRELIRPIHYFSEFTTIKRAFEVFMKSKEQMGVVVDERGNLLGIITWDDIQGYIMGGLWEEGIDEEEEIVEIEKGRWIVDGSIEKEKFERLLSLELPEGPYTTLGGFLCFYNGDIPERGKVIEYKNYTFKVLQRDERRIIKIMVESHVQEE